MIFKIDGPGLLHVRSRISNPALKEAVFTKWYDEEHIPERVSTSGIKSGFRYIDINKTPGDGGKGDERNPKPFFAFYPMADLRFTQGEEFKGISVTGKEIPGSGVVYDFAEFDVSYMGKRNVCPRKGKEKGEGGAGTAQFILTFGIRPNEQKLSESQLDDFFAKQTAQLSGLRGYSRTSTFDLRYARTNAESRKLKGLPPSDEPSPEPSTWLAMHEFDERPSGGVVEKVRKSVRELEGDVVEDIHVWELQKTHGTGRFFE